MRIGMTSTAYLQGVLNALVCSVGVLGAWLTIAWLISLIADKRLGEAGAIAFAVIWVDCLLVLVAGWTHGLRCRGRLLLDCGGHPTRWLFFVNAAVLAITGICSIFATKGFLGQWGMLFAFSFAAYWVFMGMGRLRIHEHGIWSFWGLIKWDRIKEYSWAVDGTLLMRTTGTLSSLLRGALPVPGPCVDEFKRLLMERTSPVRTP